MSYTAVVIELPDEEGQITVRKTHVPESDSLQFLQRTVGGYIEHLCTPDGTIDFWFNEEGKLQNLPVNNVATDLLWHLDPRFIGEDVLVGPVILTSNRGPETASIPAGFWEHLQGLAWAIEINWVDEEATNATA